MSTWVLFSSVMLLLVGSWNSLIGKSTAKLRAPGLADESIQVCKLTSGGQYFIFDGSEPCKGIVTHEEPVDAPFKNPLWQVLAMFVGMISNLVFHVASRNPKEPPLPRTAIYGFMAPSIFSLFASALMMASLKFLPVSTYEILRGSTLLWTALLAQLISTPDAPKETWTTTAGIITVFAGLALTGISSIPSFSDPISDILPASSSPPHHPSAASELLIGAGLVLAGSMSKALMVVSEHFFVRKFRAPPLAAVGYQGAWGCALTLAALLLLHLLPGPDHGSLVSLRQPVRQLVNSAALRAALAGTAGGMAAYNYFGVIVSRGLSPPHRVLIDSLRVTCTWAAALLAGMEPLSSVSPPKLVGLLLLLAGTVLYTAGRRPAPPAKQD